MGGVDQQIHEDLVDLGGKTFHFGQSSVFLDDFGLVLDFVVDDVECAAQAMMQVGSLPYYWPLNLVTVRDVAPG